MFILHIIINFILGIIILMSILASGFSGSLIYVGIAISICCLIGFFASYIPSKRYRNLFWLWGLCYISLPLAFALVSGENNPTDTMKLRLIWSAILFIIYIASVIGGLFGRKKSKSAGLKNGRL